MKALIKNKRGFAFPTVLGTFVLVTSIAAGLFIMVMNMTMMVSSDSESSEQLFNARNSIDVYLDAVLANESILAYEDLIILDDLRIELGLQPPEQTSDINRVRIFYELSSNKQISSYILFGTTGSNVITIEDVIDQVSNHESAPLGFNHSWDEDTVITGDWTINQTHGEGNIQVADGKTLYIDGQFQLLVSNQAKFNIVGNVCFLDESTVKSTNQEGGNQVNISINGDMCSYDNLVFNSQNQGNIQLNGNLDVEGDLDFIATNQGSHKIDVTGNVSVSGNTNIETANQGSFILDGDLNVNGTLDIKASNGGDHGVNIKGDTIVLGNTLLETRNNGFIDLGGKLIIDGNLDISGRDYGQGIKVDSDTLVFGNTKIELEQGTEVHFGGNLSIDGTFNIKAKVNSGVKILGNTIALGNTHFETANQGKIILDGLLNTDGTLNIISKNNGTVKISEVVVALGDTYFETNAQGKIHLEESLSIDGSLNIIGNNNNGGVEIDGNTVVISNVVIAVVNGSRVNIYGNHDIGGNLVISQQGWGHVRFHSSTFVQGYDDFPNSSNVTVNTTSNPSSASVFNLDAMILSSFDYDFPVIEDSNSDGSSRPTVLR